MSSKFYISDLNAQGAKGGSDFKYSIKVEAPNGLNKIYEDEPALHIKLIKQYMLQALLKVFQVFKGRLILHLQIMSLV